MDFLTNLFKQPVNENKYNWIPDLPDGRDHVYNDVKAKQQSNVIQSKLSGYKISSLQINTVNSVALAYKIKNNQYKEISRLYLYYYARKNKDVDEPVSIRDTLKVLSVGVPYEEDYPFVETHFAVKPTTFGEKSNKISGYKRVPVSVESFKNVISYSLGPIIIGYSVPDNFECVTSLIGSDSAVITEFNETGFVATGTVVDFHIPFSFVETGYVGDAWVITCGGSSSGSGPEFREFREFDD